MHILRAPIGFEKGCYDIGDSQHPDILVARQLGNILAVLQLYILLNSATRQLRSLATCRSTTCQIGAWQLGSSTVSQPSSFVALQFGTLGSLATWQLCTYRSATWHIAAWQIGSSALRQTCQLSSFIRLS